MERVMKLLEEHVQWIALGLAVLFLGWVAWAYAVHSQVTVSLGNTPVSPGELESRIASEPIAKLDSSMKNTEEIVIAVPDFVQPWLASVAGSSKAPVMLAGGVTPYDPTLSIQGPILVKKEGGLDAAPIKDFVTPPIPEPVAVVSLRTTIEYPDPKQAAPVGNAPAQQAMITANTDVVSTLFKVNTAKLGDAFRKLFDKKANVPDSAYFTAFLTVDLVREEQLPNGTWSEDTTIKPLIIHPLMDFPGDNAIPEKGLEFRDWAEKHADEIIHPEFYQTAQGAPVWHRPDQPADAAKAPVSPAIAPAPQPPAFPRGPMPGLQPGLRNPGSLLHPGGGAAYGRPGGAYAPSPGGFPQPNPGNGPFVTPFPQPGVRPDFNNAGFGNPQGGMLDTRKMGGDIEIIAHDDSVQPGKTYRYKLRYRIFNSVYNTTNIATPKVAGQFAIASGWSNATASVSIPDRTNFFVKGISTTEVRFDVFTWDGNMKVKEVRAGPGDAIGATHWSVVDIRHDSRKSDQLYVILTDDTGSIQRRDFRADQDNADYKNLLDQSKSAASAR